MKMKHMISNKIKLFFAYTKGITNVDDMQSVKDYHRHLKITPEDFERSIIFFKESLYEFNIDAAVVAEAVDFYKTLRRHLAYYPEDNLEEIKKEHEAYREQEESKREFKPAKIKITIENDFNNN